MTPRSARALLVALGVSCLLATLAPARHAAAGACATFGTLALELVDPGAPITLAPDAGPLVVHAMGGERLTRAQLARQRDVFAPLRVRGPGAPRVTPRQIAPGLHRLEASYRPGRYRVTGIQAGGVVDLVPGTPPALEAPALASARLVVQTSSAGSSFPRGGPTTTRTLEVTLSRPAPAGAWRLLLYPSGSSPPHSALSSVGTAPGRTSAAFVQGTGSNRCGPNLPQGGVPVVGAEIAVAWLTASGRISPLSNRVATTDD